MWRPGAQSWKPLCPSSNFFSPCRCLSSHLRRSGLTRDWRKEDLVREDKVGLRVLRPRWSLGDRDPSSPQVLQLLLVLIGACHWGLGVLAGRRNQVCQAIKPLGSVVWDQQRILKKIKNWKIISVGQINWMRLGNDWFRVVLVGHLASKWSSREAGKPLWLSALGANWSHLGQKSFVLVSAICVKRLTAGGNRRSKCLASYESRKPSRQRQRLQVALWKLHISFQLFCHKLSCPVDAFT